jgi:hypothetical protein
MAQPTEHKRTLSNMLASRLVPQRFLAAQLRKPTGRFGRWVMTSGSADAGRAVGHRLSRRTWSRKVSAASRS